MANALEFKVLGPVEVRLCGEPVLLRATTQRRLLAALLAGSGEVVPINVLIDSVWEVSPPSGARRSLPVYLHRLRRSLGDEDRVVRELSGYRIRVTADEFDAQAFELLVGEARAAQERNMSVRSADLYRRAVRLWRGRPYADVPAVGPICHEVHRLSELHLAARQELLETRLDLGMHVAVAAELDQLVREHPFRERLTVLRMLALYRSGRQTEALQAFHETMRILGTEMGIEPGPLLKRVHEAILRSDERLQSVRVSSLDGAWVPLDSPVVDAAAPTTGAPRELPAVASEFTGREAELAALECARSAVALQPGPTAPVVVVSGMAGVGKTTTALRWAHLIADDYPDGQLFLNLRGHVAASAQRPLEALASMLRSLGVSNDRIPVDADEAAARFRTMTSGRRLLIVLDDAASARQVGRLLPVGSQSLVIVTSRSRLLDLLARHGGRSLELAPMTRAEAVGLLRSVLDDPKDAQDATFGELARVCGYLPLALRIAGASLNGRSDLACEEFVGRLVEARGIDRLRVGGSPDAAVKSTFDSSYRSLGTSARTVFRLLGAVPVGLVSEAGTAALADMSASETRAVVEQLVDANMIGRDRFGRLYMHDLVRSYARALASDDGCVEAALRRFFDWYLDMAGAACERLYPGHARLLEPEREAPAIGRDEAATWLDDERENLIVVARHAADRGHGSVAWRLVDIVRAHIWAQMDGVDFLSLARAALDGAGVDGDPSGGAVAELAMSTARMKTGQFPDAIPHAERAVVHARRIGWKAGEASARHNATFASWQTGNLWNALRHGEEALRLNRALGRRHAQSANLGALGVVHGEMGDLRRERELHEEALRIAEATGSAPLRATHLRSLVWVAIDLGELEHASRCLDRIEGLEDGADRGRRSGSTLQPLAAYLCAAGKYDEALASARRAVREADENGSGRMKTLGLTTLAATLNRLERYGEAMDAATRALDTCGPELRGSSMNVMIQRAAARIELGTIEDAALDAERVLELARDGGFRIAEGKALNLLAETELRRGAPERAAELAGTAAGLLRSSGHRAGEAWSTWVLASIASMRGGEPSAFERDVERIYTEMNAPIPPRFRTRPRRG